MTFGFARREEDVPIASNREVSRESILILMEIVTVDVAPGTVGRPSRRYFTFYLTIKLKFP